MTTQPNVLLLFSDQHQAACLGIENHPDVMTPHLDALAQGGIRFTRATCQNAICLPSRISMMTGLHPQQLGVFGNADAPPILEQVVPLSEYFSSRGYATAAFGKRHLGSRSDNAGDGPRVDQGWDIKKSHMATEGDADNYVRWIEESGYINEFTSDWAAEFGHGPAHSATSDTDIPFAPFAFRISQLPDDKTMEAYTAHETIQFIKDRANSDQPFFCWSSFYRPHQPYTPLQTYLDRYAASEWGTTLTKPASFPDDFAAKKTTLPPMFQGQYEGENRVWCIDRAQHDHQLYRDYIAAYYALVTEIDDHIGRIIQCLKDEGLYDNTIIIYASDHGDFVGSHGMIEKCAPGHNIYEETLRVPLIIHYPKALESGQVSDALVELTDLYPTLAELTGDQVPTFEVPLAGKSLVPLLGPTAETVSRSFREYSVSLNRSQATVITRRYKLGIWRDPGKGYEQFDFRAFGNMLFDRETDPHEEHNRYGDAEYALVQQQLTDYLTEWFADFEQEL